MQDKILEELYLIKKRLENLIQDRIVFYTKHETDLNRIESIIINDTCELFNTTIRDIISRKKENEYVIARTLISVFLYHINKYSSNKIGNILNRDHSTIIDKLKKFKYLYETQNPFLITNLNYLLSNVSRDGVDIFNLREFISHIKIIKYVKIR